MCICFCLTNPNIPCCTKKIYHGVFIVRSMFYDLHIFDEEEGISSTNTIHWVSEWVGREGRARVEGCEFTFIMIPYRLRDVLTNMDSILSGT